MQTAKTKARAPSAGSKTNLHGGLTRPVPSQLSRSVEVTFVPLSPEKAANVFYPVRSNSAIELTNSEVNLSNYPPSPYELDLVGHVSSPLVPASSLSSAWCSSSFKSQSSIGSRPVGKFSFPIPRHYQLNPAILRKSALKSPPSCSGMGVALSPLRKINRVGVSSHMQKENSPLVSPISPYDISAINSPEPRTRTNSAHRVRFQLDTPSSKTKLAPGEYDHVENYSNVSTLSPIQHCQSQESEPDHPPCTSHSCYDSHHSECDSSSSLPALFSPQLSLGRNKSSNYYCRPQQQNYQQVSQGVSLTTTPCSCQHNHQGGIYPPNPQEGSFPPKPQEGSFPPSPQEGVYPPNPQEGSCPPNHQEGIFPPSPQEGIYPPNHPGGIFQSNSQGAILSHLFFLSPLSAQKSPSPTMRSGWVWPSLSDNLSDVTGGKVGVNGPRPMQQESVKHYQTHSDIPITRASQFLRILQAFG